MTAAANNATPATETQSAAVIERAATGSAPEYKFMCLAHARKVRDDLCEYALEHTTSEQIERWCRAEGDWQEDIESLMQWIGEHWDGNGMPGYWLYLRELKAAIQYIATAERVAVAQNDEVRHGGPDV